MALADRIVVGVVRRRHLHRAGAELAVDVVVGDDRDDPVRQRQPHAAADEAAVALVFGMDHHRHVAEHRLRPRRRHHQLAAAVLERIADVPQEAVLLLALDLQVGDRRLQHRVPVDEPLAAVDEAFLVEPHEGLGDDRRQPLVHREVLARPGHRGAHAAHLAGDGRAALLLPLPDAIDEGLAAERMAVLALLLQLALDDDLRRDAGMVHARQPQRVVAAHAVPARQRVHDRLVERMAHVQRAGDVRRRQLDAERRLRLVERRVVHAARFPKRRPARLDGGGLEGLGQFGHAVVGRRRRMAAGDPRRDVVGGPRIVGSGVPSGPDRRPAASPDAAGRHVRVSGPGAARRRRRRRRRARTRCRPCRRRA